MGLRSLPAWLVSLCIHFAILATVGLFWASKPKGTGGEADRPVGVAVVYQAAGGDVYFLGESGSSDADNPDTQQAIAATAPNSAALSESELLSELLPGSASASGELASAAGALGLGDGGAALGEGRNIPKVKTTVFGIEGEGTRFLYVFDRSDSMNGYGGLPLQSAKSQLLESLQSLGPTHQFQIIFYNDTPLPYGGLGGRGPRLLKGDEPTKLAAQRFVREISAIGGTRHIDALKMSLAMGPDVIFFLTDADQPAPSAAAIEDLHTRASRSGTTIHCIQFGAGSNQVAGSWIKLLATGTAGKYRYIDVAQLATGSPLVP